MTKVVTRGVDTTVNYFYRHSRIKGYLKDGKALRSRPSSTTRAIWECSHVWSTFPNSSPEPGDANDRLLHAQHGGQDCVLASPAFERVALPSVTTDGRRAPALRFGDPRVMALVGALTTGIYTATGITNRSLRALVAGLLGIPHTANQMDYDLGRLRLNGLIERVQGTNTYLLTDDGQRVAMFYARSTPASCVHCWPRTDHRHPPNSALPCTPSPRLRARRTPGKAA